MDLREQYEACIASIDAITREQEGNYARLEEVSRNIARQIAERGQFEREIQDNLSKLAEQEIQNRIEEQQAIILKTMNELTSRKLELGRRLAQRCKEDTGEPIKQMVMPEVRKLRQAKNVIDRGSEIFDSAYSEVIRNGLERTIIETPEEFDIEELTTIVATQYEHAPDIEQDSIFSKVIRGFVLDINSFEKLKPKTRLLLYALYLFIVIALFVKVTWMVIVPYSIMLMVAVVTNYKQLRNLVKYLYPYMLLKTLHSNKFMQVENYMMAKRNEVESAAKKEYQAKCDKIDSALREANYRRQAVPAEVRKNASVDELTKTAKERYMARLAATQEEIESSNKESTRLNQFILNNTQQLAQLASNRDTLKQQLVAEYLDPKTPGTSKLLVKSFFLGMDDRGELIEFTYDGKTTLIVYKGEDNRVNGPLISMMLMQLFSTMSIISVRINLVDMRSGGQQYASFAHKDLDGRVKVIGTDKDLRTTIDDIHNEYLFRNTEILSEAEHIDVYNARMIETQSLTYDYVFFFVQDPDMSILATQKMLQLCRTGPTVGIIPIIFLSNRTINETIQNARTNELDSLRTFLESLEEQVFVYVGNTQDLLHDPTIKYKIIDGTKGGRKI